MAPASPETDADTKCQRPRDRADTSTKDAAMNINDLNLGRDALEALLGLALKVELHGNRQYKVTKSLDDFVALLKVSQVADVQDIRDALQRFTTILTSDQQAFLRVLGVDIQPRTVSSRSYRGRQVAEAQPEDTGQERDEGQEGKKKVIYRGRIHWV